jgi:invasion protein IalB
MEQTAVLSKTGQLIVLVNIRVPSDSHLPVILVQLPLGLNLPGGAKLQVDDGKTADLQIQTCENRGCYAGTAIAPDVLAALKSGKELKLSFQNLAKETITIPAADRFCHRLRQDKITPSSVDHDGAVGNGSMASLPAGRSALTPT